MTWVCKRLNCLLLRTSRGTAAGVTARLFEVADLVALLVESESKKAA
jgi:hypothetical protein